TATISGFVNGDTAAVVSGSPALTTTATSSSPAGTYPIIAGIGTLAAANYDFPTRVNGSLTVSLTGNLDYDGVGHAELAVFRPSTAHWFVLGPNGGHLMATYGGTNGLDIPVPGDYDGVGHAELAVFRPSTAQWFVLGPNGGHL